jgi:hypothetical protein
MTRGERQGLPLTPDPAPQQSSNYKNKNSKNKDKKVNQAAAQHSHLPVLSLAFSLLLIGCASTSNAVQHETYLARAENAISEKKWGNSISLSGRLIRIKDTRTQNAKQRDISFSTRTEIRCNINFYD